MRGTGRPFLGVRGGIGILAGAAGDRENAGAPARDEDPELPGAAS
jgi:hypothetical protein